MKDNSPGRVDEERGFGGFTFVNNGPDKGGDEAAVTPSTDPKAKSHRAPNTVGGGNLIPNSQKGNSPYESGLGGGPRQELLFWVASRDVVKYRRKWRCYTLTLSEPAVGVEVTGEKEYDLLDKEGGCTVRIQLVENGPYADDPTATVRFRVDDMPTW